MNRTIGTGKMNVNRRIIYWAAVFAVLFFTFLFGYLRKSAEKPAEEKIVPVEVQTVMVGSIEETIEADSQERSAALRYRP